MHERLGALLLTGSLLLGASIGAVQAFPYGNADDEALAEAERLLAEGRPDEAEERLRAALAEEGTPAIRARLAWLLLERGQASGGEGLAGHLADGWLWEARSHFEQLREEDPSSLDPVYGFARSAEALGDDSAAIDALDRALTGAAEDERIGLEDEALRILLAADRSELFDARVQELTDAARRALWELRRHAAQRDAEAASRCAAEIAADERSAWEVGWQLWAAHQDEERPLELLLHRYSTLIDDHPDRLEYRYYRGETRVRAGDESGAESDLRPCVQQEGLEIPARFALGRALLGLGQLDAAASEFRTVVAARGDLWRRGLDGLLDVAVRHGTAGRHSVAQALYEEVLAEAPDDEFALLGLPLCSKGVDDVAAAEAAYRRALEIRPEHPQLLNDLALLLRGAGDDAQARQLFERAAASGSIDATENLGVVALYEDLDPSAAAGRFARVLVMDPERPKSRFYRELCLSRAARGERSDEGGEPDSGGR